jgi:hypothetical protein
MQREPARCPQAERGTHVEKDGHSGAVAHPLHGDWVRCADFHTNLRYEEPCRDRVAASRVGRYLVNCEQEP